MPRGKPPIGYPVQYFEQPDKSGPPIAARIIRVFENGSCDLTLDTPTGGHGHRRGVFMFKDPELEARKDTEWGQKTGVWDYIEGLPKLGLISNAQLAKDAEDAKAEAELAREQRRKEAAEKAKAKELQPA